MGNKIGICTVYTGYNYGSALQAYSTKHILSVIGYNGVVFKLSGSIIKGRDVRLKKLTIIIMRSIFHTKDKKTLVKSFKNNNKGKMNQYTIDRFNIFYEKYINPIIKKYSYFKKVSKTNEYIAFICGSDQIWNSTALYVDPFYYLRFTPKRKRIAYAPSFGRNYLPNYNIKKISKYINDIKYLSVREDSAKNIIKNLINRDVEICLDPTLLIKKESWIKQFNLNNKLIKENYILCYFLNEPTDAAKSFINKISTEKSIKVYYLNNNNNYNKCLYGGPIEFLNYVYNASCILTDSFHGVAFSINLNKDFYVFDRNYSSENQSTRILSFLKITNLDSRFNPIRILDEINYKKVNKIIEIERKKSINYLINSIDKIKG